MRIAATVIYFIYTVIAGILSIPIWLFLFIVSRTVSKKKTYEKTSMFYTKVFSFGYRLCAFFGGARVKVTGLELLPSPEGEKFLIVGNHCSNLDPFIMGGWLKKYPIAFISKPSVFDLPIAGRYMWRLRYMAIDRKNNRQGIQVIRQAADMISSGDSCVAVYPEGTRNFDNKTLKKFHDGSLKSALWAKCPIAVCVMTGAHDISKNWLRRRTRVTLDIVEVIPYEEIKDLKTPEIAERIKATMQARLDKIA
ncbi:MAG: 1-acyl-sn-glycerol-3-phosphate acyltransferase [Clostridiales bacterium]|nr:1-acyl-sn-glycerol-3-phosphate acyltransferase [Clostridiales bacterium]